MLAPNYGISNPFMLATQIMYTMLGWTWAAWLTPICKIWTIPAEHCKAAGSFVWAGHLKIHQSSSRAIFFCVYWLATCPDHYKPSVVKKASASSWLNAEVHTLLRPMLPEKDHACYLDLPWTRQKGNIKTEAVILANQSVANLYCPALRPAFSLMLAGTDWTNREKVCHVANLGHVGNTPLEEFALGDLLAME